MILGNQPIGIPGLLYFGVWTTFLGIGWTMDIVTLIEHGRELPTAMSLVRYLGIFALPLGGIVGCVSKDFPNTGFKRKNTCLADILITSSMRSA